MNVETILSRKGSDVQTISRTSALADAVRLLGEKNIGAVVVTEADGTCCGILSERDIVRQLAATASPQEYLGRPIDQCMTADVFTCSKSADVEEVLSMMTQKRIRHLPIVEEGRLAGIVSIGDVVKVKIDAAEQEAETLRSYISAG